MDIDVWLPLSATMVHAMVVTRASEIHSGRRSRCVRRGRLARDNDTAVPFVLCLIQRAVGTDAELVQTAPVARCQGDPDAGSDPDLMTAKIVRLAKGANNPVCQQTRFVRLTDAILQHDKFIAAHASNRVAKPGRFLQALSHRLQQRIANGMTKLIVDRLESVQVEIMERQQFAGLRNAGDGLIEFARATRYGWVIRSRRRGPPRPKDHAWQEVAEASFGRSARPFRGLSARSLP